MFRKRNPGVRIISEALKTVRDDLTTLVHDTPDPESLKFEADRRRTFARDLLARLDEGEMDEKYAQVPDALDKLFTQIAHASLLAEACELLSRYDRARHSIYSEEG